MIVWGQTIFYHVVSTEIKPEREKKTGVITIPYMGDMLPV